MRNVGAERGAEESGARGATNNDEVNLVLDDNIQYEARFNTQRSGSRPVLFAPADTPLLYWKPTWCFHAQNHNVWHKCYTIYLVSGEHFPMSHVGIGTTGDFGRSDWCSVSKFVLNTLVVFFVYFLHLLYPKHYAQQIVCFGFCVYVVYGKPRYATLDNVHRTLQS